MIASARVVDAVALSYQDGPAREWVTQLLECLLTILPARTATFYEFKLRPVKGGSHLTITSPIQALGDRVQTADAFERFVAQPPETLHRLFHRTCGNTASDLSGFGPGLAKWPGWREMWEAPIDDSLGLVICEPTGDGALFCTGLTSAMTLSSREQALATKLAMHLAAGVRMRRGDARPSLERAEAILSPHGKVLHARARAQGKLDDLDEGRRRRNEAQKARHDAEKALEIWKGLVAGRWSLVDHFDTDGKRFLLAMKNTPKVDRPIDLTPGAKRAAALAAMGHRDKEIAYMLGVSVASVTASLHRTRAKLGVRSRAELATVWPRLAPQSRTNDP